MDMSREMQGQYIFTISCHTSNIRHSLYNMAFEGSTNAGDDLSNSSAVSKITIALVDVEECKWLLQSLRYFHVSVGNLPMNSILGAMLIMDDSNMKVTMPCSNRGFCSAIMNVFYNADATSSHRNNKCPSCGTINSFPIEYMPLVKDASRKRNTEKLFTNNSQPGGGTKPPALGFRSFNIKDMIRNKVKGLIVSKMMVE